MSKAVVVYAVLALVFWLPAALSVHRRMGEMSMVEQLVAGLVVALGWPLTAPALGLSRVARHA